MLATLLEKPTFKRRASVTIFLACIATVFLSIYLDEKRVLWGNILSLTQNEEKPTTSLHHGIKAALTDDDFCRFRALSPKEEVEERVLLESYAWPQTPSLPEPFSVQQTSNPAGSSFTIFPTHEGQQWHVGDQLKVTINILDFQGNPKTTGGDFVIARLHDPVLLAGVAGQVVDHLNGTYSAVFPLLWEGKAAVEVTLVHPSEAITVLRRVARELPDRVNFSSVFRKGSVSETTVCNVCLRPAEGPVCDFTDARTGETWFCYKPKRLDCGDRVLHNKMPFAEHFGLNEKVLFQSGTNLKVAIPPLGPESVNVLPVERGTKNQTSDLGISGFYHHNLWRSLSGAPTRHFDTPAAINQCLQGKVLNLLGDSTIRQWYTYFIEKLPELKQFDLHTSQFVGPLLALDYKRNIMVKFRVHGPPVNFPDIPVAQLHYIANELDELVGGPNTVVVIGLWGHLGAFPIRIYIRRLQSIRQAVIRLLTRAPDTVVVIRTANLKSQTPLVTWVGSDWYSMERDKILRAIFKHVNVRWVDAWEMTIAHYLPHNLHPQAPIVKNMIDVLLSHICPLKQQRHRGRM
ncbi:NXPE family member 3-like [Neosynchiropus ocellatus]